MVSQDYEQVIRTGKLVEKELLRCISQVYIGDPANLRRQLFIPPGCHIIDRYVEAVYLDNTEIMTLEISGRAVDIKPIGYRT